MGRPTISEWLKNNGVEINKAQGNFPNSKIVSAAIRYKGVTISLPQPTRHNDVLRWLYAETGAVLGPNDQGFLTNYGIYVTRGQAYMIALANGQLKAPKETAELFTEDLW